MFTVVIACFEKTQSQTGDIMKRLSTTETITITDGDEPMTLRASSPRAHIDATDKV